MSDNTVLNSGSGGDTVAADDIGGIKFQRVKLALGIDGTNDGDVATANPLPISDAGGSITVDGTFWQATQPVSGTVTANAGSNLNTSTLALEAGGNLATVAALSRAEDAAHSSGHTGVMLLAVREATVTDLSAGSTDGDYEPLQVSAAGRLWVSATVDAALPAGTNGIGKLTANSGVTIGAVEIAAAQTLATVTTVSTVTTCSTLTGGAVAHDGADSGNPVKVGAKANSSLKGATLVASADRTDLTSDLDGAIYARSLSWGDLINERVADTGGTSSAFSNFSAVASTRNYITSVTIHNAHASTNGYVDLRDGTAGAVLWTFPAPATGGATHNFDPPLRQPTTNTALAYDVSAAITTVYISVNGFQSKV